MSTYQQRQAEQIGKRTKPEIVKALAAEMTRAAEQRETMQAEISALRLKVAAAEAKAEKYGNVERAIEAVARLRAPGRVEVQAKQLALTSACGTCIWEHQADERGLCKHGDRIDGMKANVLTVDEATEEIIAEICDKSDEICDRLEDSMEAEEREREREAMLSALGWNEIQWLQTAWKFGG